ncbi:hypothetical protein K501DRAFT_332472 [Backusella circina FSU 941]|nr:hypothetical protein K501DRAFT_332472 [Backusella circina FSU 941]
MTSTVDTKIFSKPDFDVKKWINSVLKPADQDNESIALVTRLQMASDTTSHQFDQLTNSVIKSMPRLLYDLKSITDDASKTKERVELVKKDYLNLMEGGSAELALDKLKRPHIVKTRMEQCRSLLKEAENWSHLEVEAERAIENLQFEDAASRLQSAQHSLDVFQNTAEYEIRHGLLIRLQDELKSRMKEEVVKSLQEHDSVTCYKYYKIYGKIGRSEDFVDLYFEVRNPVVLKNWVQEDDLETRLNRFYKALISMLSDEYVWSASIFPDPKPVIQALVQHILESLDPSALQCLERTQEEMKQSALPSIVSAFKVTETFGLELEKLFSKPPVITASTEHAESFDTHIKSHTRRHSRSGSISLVPLTLRQNADSNSWSYILYEPFLPIQSQYGNLEQAYLEYGLKAIFKKDSFTGLFQSGSGTMEIVQYIAQDIISSVFQCARESIDRCLTLTHGYGGVEWLKAFNQYIKSTLSEIRKVAHRVENMSSKDSELNRQEKEEDRRQSQDELYDFESELEKGDDSTFQVGLRLLGICQSMDQHVSGIQDTLSREFEFVKSIVLFGKEDHVPPPTPTNERPLHKRSSSIDQWRSHERKRSSSGADFINQTSNEKYPRASISLLQSSILNTHELQSLMTKVSSLSEVREKTPIGKMLTPCENEIQSFTEHCQHFVHDAVKAPIKRYLATIPTMDSVWTVDDEQQDDDSDDGEDHTATTDIQVPRLSLSPNEYVTHVGEQLLMLPQQFEVYAHDDALSYRIESLPYIKDFDDVQEEGEQQKNNDESINEEEEEEEEDKQDNDDDNDSKKSNEQAIELWTTSVARGTMVEFIKEIKNIRNMTYHGGRQLRTDIEYLINVLSTLDVQPLPELVSMYRYFDLEESDLIKQLMNAKKNPNLEGEDALKAVAEIRGVVLLEL